MKRKIVPEPGEDKKLKYDDEVNLKFVEYDIDNFAFAVGHWSLIVAPPGSGKTHFIQEILNNSKKWMRLKRGDNNRLLVFPGDGDIKVDAEHIRSIFNRTVVSYDVVEDLPKFQKDFQKFDSNVIIIDDFIFFNSISVQGMLRDLLFKRLRHKKLLVIIAVHTLTHIALFGSFLAFAKTVFFLSSNANRNSVNRLCYVNGCPQSVKDELTKELNSMSTKRRVGKVFDSFAFDTTNHLCVYNVQSKPLFEKKRSFQDLNLAVDIFDEMAGKYYLVPEEKLVKHRRSLSFPAGEKDLMELLDPEGKDILKELKSAGAVVKLKENCLEFKNAKLPLLQTLLSIKRGEKVREIPDISSRGAKVFDEDLRGLNY